MSLTRRTTVLLQEEDYQLLARIAQRQGMPTTTMARVMILRGMTEYLSTLKAEQRKKLDKDGRG